MFSIQSYGSQSVASAGMGLNGTHVFCNFQTHPFTACHLGDLDNLTIQITSKTVAEVAGEKILRPALDSLFTVFRETYRNLIDVVTVVDRALSKPFAIFPFAEAADNPTHSQEEEASALVRVIHSEPIPPAKFKDLLPSDGRVVLNNDKMFNKHFREAMSMREEVDKFLDDWVEKCANFGNELTKYHTSYQSIYEKLKEIRKELTLDNAKSLFLPFSGGDVSMVLPRLETFSSVSDPNKINECMARGGELFHNGKSLLQSLPLSDDEQTKKSLKKVFAWKFFDNTGDALTIIDGDFNGFNVDTFRGMYTKSTIDQAREVIDERKMFFTKWVINGSALKEQRLGPESDRLMSDIKQTIISIRNEQQRMIKGTLPSPGVSYKLDELPSADQIPQWRVNKTISGWFPTTTVSFTFIIKPVSHTVTC